MVLWETLNKCHGQNTERTGAPGPSPPLPSDSSRWILRWIYTRLCFPCKYFSSISQQICHRETQQRNASAGRYRDGTFQSFVLRWLFRSSCLKLTPFSFFLFFLYLTLLFGEWQWGPRRASHAFLPPSPLDCHPSPRGHVRFSVSSIPGDNAPLDLWPRWGKGKA